ncbi:MAG: hypothetical protein IPI67_30665 [Myxococcales bacterium]|nr:hypothetical protein [Myxococcales bacterium]
MRARRARVHAAIVGIGVFCLGIARADLPPPDGQTGVDYAFRVSGAATGVVLVAFPMYSSDGGHILKLAFDQDARPVQGWTPGIYSVGADALASIKDTADDDAIRALLASKAHMCVKQVPRVRHVPRATRVNSITDVFRVEATAAACKTTFDKTLYGGAKGMQGEGTVDTTGRRLAPAPFGSELPNVGDLGFTLTQPALTPPPAITPTSPAPTPSPPTPATSTARPDSGSPPSRSGCAGCAVPSSQESNQRPAAWAVFAVGLLRRRRARK